MPKKNRSAASAAADPTPPAQPATREDLIGVLSEVLELHDFGALDKGIGSATKGGKALLRARELVRAAEAAPSGFQMEGADGEREKQNLRELINRHRAGVGERPWVKYADMSYDTRLQSIFYVRLRGYGWEREFYARHGSIYEQIERFFERAEAIADTGAVPGA